MCDNDPNPLICILQKFATGVIQLRLKWYKDKVFSQNMICLKQYKLNPHTYPHHLTLDSTGSEVSTAHAWNLLCNSFMAKAKSWCFAILNFVVTLILCFYCTTTTQKMSLKLKLKTWTEPKTRLKPILILFKIPLILIPTTIRCSNTNNKGFFITSIPGKKWMQMFPGNCSALYLISIWLYQSSAIRLWLVLAIKSLK